MGVVALVMLSLEGFRVVSILGMPQAVIYFRELTSKQLSSLYTVNWILAGILYFIVVLLSDELANLFSRPEIAVYLPVAGLIIIINASGQQVMSLLQKDMKFKRIALINTIEAMVNVAVAVVLVSLEYGVWSVLVGYVSSSLVKNAICIAHGLRENLFFGFGRRLGSVKPVLRYGGFQAATILLNWFNDRIDQIIIGKYLGGHSLGLYATGSQLTTQFMQQINGVATKVSFPEMSKANGNNDEIRRLYLQMTAMVMFVLCPVFLGMASISDLLVDLLLGDKWSDLPPILNALCFYMIIRSMDHMLGPLVMGTGRVSLSFRWSLCMAVMLPLIIIISVKLDSVEFLVWVLCFFRASAFVLGYWFFIKPVSGPCGVELMGAVVRPFCSAFIMYLVVSQINFDVYVYSQSIVMILNIALGAVMYLMASMALNGVVLGNFISLLGR